jgi:TolB-like protein/predicted Zn-dependent protease
LIGRSIAHYRITTAIGAGGMGEVYRATDTRLHRDVALKVLPPEMAASPERIERFRREARAVAALNHPHVVTIYSVEEAEGVHFITMELVDGQPLDRLITAGGMDIRRMLDIAGGLADALAAAHARGIVHRDLKPANVMITKEQCVKVLDFGLAKMTAPVEAVASMAQDRATEMRTQEGVVMGTMPYMSPEQLHGRELDHRTDLFSLGVMLYEMASGERPFRGDSSVALASAILRDTPRPLVERRKDLPEGLIRIITRCMEKSATDRFPSAQDLRGALGGVSRTGGGSAQPISSEGSAVIRADEGLRIAVLPFKSVGSGSDPALAEGLSEEIATGFSRFRYLSVASKASPDWLAPDSGSGRTADRTLGARYVLEGSVRLGGSAVRVNAHLVDTRSGAQLWSETFNRDLQTSGFFQVQDDLSARIVATVGDSNGVLVHAMRSAIRQKDDDALTPGEWQLQYFACREQITPAVYSVLKSRVQRALERDNRQSDLWACLAQIWVDEYVYGFGDDEVPLDRALAASRRAVELDRGNQFALGSLAQTLFFRRDVAAFVPAAERAMALNPLNTEVVGYLGLQIVHTGEFARGAAIVRRAMELNPNHAGWMHFAPLWEHFHKGEYEEALSCVSRGDVPGLSTVRSIDRPRQLLFWPFLVTAAACGHLGRRGEAAAAVRDLLELDSNIAAHARATIEMWHFASGLVEPLLDGLRKAGLSIPASDGAAVVSSGQRTISAVRDRTDPAPDSGQLRSEEGFWVAVLPVRYSGNDADLTSLAEGLTESVLTGLSRFSYLRVIARTSMSQTRQGLDVGSAGAELGARYVVEGSLRKAGTKVRLAMQLVDTASGAHLWAETWDRAFDPAAALELQDELVARTVSVCADRFGVLARSISESVRGKVADQLSPYEALMRGFGYHHRLTQAEHAEAREALERAVERAPLNADCWAMLSWTYSHEHAHGFNALPGSLDRALAAARRAVDLAPSNPLAQQTLAVVLFFRKERAGCLSAAERALTLNPLDTSNEAIFLLMFTGDWDRGCALLRRAMELNPHHPRWYGAALGFNEYRLANYRAAVDEVVKANAPEVFWSNVILAAAHAQLGDLASARNAVRDLLAQKEDFARSAGEDLVKWMDRPLVGHLIEGLRKAGLEIDWESGGVSLAAESSKSPAPISGESRAEEGFWVAVLPFRYSGANSELPALAEGLTEEIVTGLSRFSYLRVIARSSTSRYASESVDVRTAGKDLGARYVMEASLRQAGTKLRLAVQLVDAVSGAHLWAENYERLFSPDSVFEVQDELVPRIVSTVADQYGALVHSMSESLRDRSAGQYSAHEAVLRSFGYWERITPEEHEEVREILEAAVAHAPGHSDCHAALSSIYAHEHAFGYNLRPDPLGRAHAAAQRAVASAPANHFGHSALASVLFFQKNFPAFHTAAERALALNPMDSSAAAVLGQLIAYAGDWEHGLGVVERAMQLNPHRPGWYHYLAFCDAYRRSDYTGALAAVLKVNMPGYFWPHVYLAAVYGQLGEQQRARAALRDLEALIPDFGARAREEFGKWLDDELTEHLLEGLRKAGLEIASQNGGVSSATGSPETMSPISGEHRAEEGFWVAVLPFKYGGANPELTTLAEGLTEDIVTGLSKFSYLRVIARSSTSRFANESVDVRSAGRELGARYVMEGSLRQAGTKLRVAVQLVDATSGANLWAENYERPFSPDTVFELQDDLVPRIVSTVADSNGILARSMSEVVRGRDPEQLSAYEAVLRSFGYAERVTPEELAAARLALEIAVRKAPAYADAWAMLAWLHLQDYGQGFDLQADSLTNGLAAARRAVDLAPSNHLAWFSLAQGLFFHKEVAPFRNAAERAVTLNPMDGNAVAFIGELLTYSGDRERGMALANRAKQLNPNYPGWYWYADFYDAYQRGDDREALNVALKINLPGQPFSRVATAVALGQLGQVDAAAKVVRDLLQIWPDFEAVMGPVIERWWETAYIERVLDGLRKAGLKIASETIAGSPALESSKTSSLISGELRADEGFWVAVLPFKYSGTNPELTTFAEGLTEDTVTGLSRFSYLRVIARGSTSRYANESVDVRTAGKDLGARYVMEGSLRQAGTKLRLAVQLVDATTGAHLWAENYERLFTPEALFELQDELVPRIVSTIADMHGVLPRSMSEVVRSSSPEQLSPYEAVLRGFGYVANLSAEEHAAARAALECAVKAAPGNADAIAMLSMLYADEHKQGFNVQPDPLGRALDAARRAVAAAPSNHLAHHALAQALFFHKEFPAFRIAAERAIALNPMDGCTTAFMGILLAYAGDWERGRPLAERAMELNPNHPGWYRFVIFNDAFRKGDYRAALDVALNFNMPSYFFTHAALAATYGHLGDKAAGLAALRELLAQKPDFHLVAREELGKWMEADLLERHLDGIRKAGLELPSSSRADTRARSDAAVSIAVLPFSDMSAAKDQEYLCEGMAEEIMNALVRIDGIRVASRTSAFRAAKNGEELSAIARSLSVEHVLEGSVRTAGARLRVTAQLTDVASGYQLWSDRFDKEAIDVFAIQDEIATGAVNAVKARLMPGTRTVHARPQPHNLEAYRAYLRGRHLRGKEDFAGAMLAFQEATRLDPAHAPSWTGLAEITVLSAHMGLILPRDACTSARKALETANRLQGESADALHVEAFIADMERRWDAMETNWRRALELQPDHVLALGSFAISLCARQRFDEARPLFERARQADPLASFPYMLAGWGLLMERRPEEALHQLEDALTFEKEDASALGALSLAHTALGNVDEAIAAGEHAIRVTYRAPFFLGIVGWALAVAGRASEARTILEELRARPAGSPTAVSEAWLLGVLGEMDEAFAVLARAEEENQGLISYTGLPGFDSLRDDSRFTALLLRLELST